MKKTDKPRPAVVNRTIDAICGKALEEALVDLDSIKERFRAELADLGAAYSMHLPDEATAGRERPLYVQTGRMKFDTAGYNYGNVELPFTVLTTKYQNVRAFLTQGWGTAIAEIARSMSAIKDDKLCVTKDDEYRYAILIFPPEKKEG